MPTGIFIPADDSVELTLREFSSLHDYRAAVGRYIEAVDLSEPKLAASALIVNEEGKFLSEPPNRRATLMLWIHQPTSRLRDEVIGDAVLVGRANIRGLFTDVPVRLQSLLFGTTMFTIETVSGIANGTKRVQHLGSFANWVNAYVVAVDLGTVMSNETEVRVVAE
jgi:hypothetical protein